MLGRKDYTQDEYDNAKTSIDRQMAAYRKLVKAVDAAPDNAELKAALDAFEPLFLNHMTLALDRYFVHRLRVVTGKDGNPLNEVELMTDALLNHDGVLTGNNVIKLKPAESVAKIELGDRIRLTAPEYDKLYKAFLADLRAKFVQ